MQCYRCQRLGHTSKGCNAKKQKCLYCSEDHKKEDCTAIIRTCANCTGPHAANSSQCKFIQEAREIDKTKAELGIDYLKAREIVLNNKQLNLNTEDFPYMQQSNNQGEKSNENGNIVPNVGNTYSDALRLSQNHSNLNHRHQERQQIIKQTADASTQTDVTKLTNDLNDELMNKIKGFVIQILQEMLGKETPRYQGASTGRTLQKNLVENLQAKKLIRQDDKINENIEETETRNSNIRKTNEIEIDTTNDEGVLSEEESSEEESDAIWQTYEKRQVRKTKNDTYLKEKDNEGKKGNKQGNKKKKPKKSK